MGIILENPKSVESPMGIIVLLLQIFLPGIGILVYNLVAKDDKWIRFLVEFFLSWLIVPWIVGIVDGVKIFQAQKPAAPAA